MSGPVTDSVLRVVVAVGAPGDTWCLGERVDVPAIAAELLAAREALRAADALAEAVGVVQSDGYDGPWIGDACEPTYAALAAYRATRTR